MQVNLFMYYYGFIFIFFKIMAYIFLRTESKIQLFLFAVVNDFLAIVCFLIAAYGF